MKRQGNFFPILFLAALLFFLSGTIATDAFAAPISYDTAPCVSKRPCPCSTADSQSVWGGSTSEECDSGCLSYSEGNFSDTHQVLSISNVFDLFLTYNSFNADGSNFRVDTVMGLGWTHSYNIFLTEYRMDIFKHGGNGRTQKFDRNPDGSYDPPEGTAQSLVKNSDNTFDMTMKDGTVYHFEKLDPPPFLMPSPPYYLTRIVDRNNRTTSFYYNSNSLLEEIIAPMDGKSFLPITAIRKLRPLKIPSAE